jgi:hypothetical protein
VRGWLSASTKTEYKRRREAVQKLGFSGTFGQEGRLPAPAPTKSMACRCVSVQRRLSLPFLATSRKFRMGGANYGAARNAYYLRNINAPSKWT